VRRQGCSSLATAAESVARKRAAMDAVRDNIVALQGLYPDAMVANMHRT